MKKLTSCIGALAVGASLFGGVAAARPYRISDPVGVLSDSDGNAGYVEADDYGVVRVCNENSNTPAGDAATGYLWVNTRGEDTTPTWGTRYAGHGDRDGEGSWNPKDCR